MYSSNNRLYHHIMHTAFNGISQKHANIKDASIMKYYKYIDINSNSVT